jgi:predicted kinase
MEGIIFIGIQASGKSTFYQRFFYKTHVRISLDMLKTRNRESILLNACIEAKQPFVIDNTNPSIVERKKYIYKLRENGLKIKGYYFQSIIKDCLERNQLRKGKDNVPEVGIKGTYNKLELPSYDEGFDELFYVSMSHNEFSVKEWKNEI